MLFQVSLLESDLSRKDSELVQMTSQYHDVDTELQHHKQDLFFHQQHISDLEIQVLDTSKLLEMLVDLL